ncbi:MAG: hypothetical protein Q4E87_01055 [bacterium]|nr:hypothetical protein [bacterium]
MASVTLENSYQSTNMDMGDSHEKAHGKQHKYLQKDEPLIETLTDNKSEDLSTNLAIKMAIKQGVKNEDDWEVYNSKLRKDRRKDSYQEYLETIAGNLIKNKRRKLDDKKHPLSKQKREKIAQELASIDRNGGIPIDGSLYYISNTIKYDEMKPDELKKYREFERATLTEFYNSKTFKELNPQNIRSEIHFDENGAIHLQTQNVWYHKDKRGRMSYAKRAEIKKILTEKYGSKMLNSNLDLLCYIHKKKDKKLTSDNRIGKSTISTYYWNIKSKDPDHAFNVTEHFSNAERTTRIEELWRMEQQKVLAEIAEQKADEMGVNWKLDEVYTTDGIHRTGSTYVEHKKALTQASAELKNKQQQVKSENEKLNNLQSQNQKIKDENDGLTAQNTKLKQQVNDQQTQLQKIQEKQETAESIYDGLSSSNKTLKSENDKLSAKNDDLQQQAEQKQSEIEAQNQRFNEAKSQLAIIQQQKKDEEEKLNKLRLKRRQQQQLETKADQYDQIKNYIGEVPQNHTLFTWIKQQFTFLQQQQKIGMEAITNADRLQKALTHNMNMHGEVADKDVKTFENQTTQTTNVLVKFVEDKYKQFKQKFKSKQQQHRIVRNNTDGPDGLSR